MVGRDWGATMHETIPFHPPWTDACFAEGTFCGILGMLLQHCVRSLQWFLMAKGGS